MLVHTNPFIHTVDNENNNNKKKTVEIEFILGVWFMTIHSFNTKQQPSSYNDYNLMDVFGYFLAAVIIFLV